MQLDLNLLNSLFAGCAGRVKYKLGAKVPLGATVAQIVRIDCSGFVRWILAKCGVGLVLPDGSQNQLDWARKNLRKLEKYSDVQYASGDPTRVFIAFLSPKPGASWPRHVWLIRMGQTMESYGSGGVGSRAWDHPSLKNCKECFELT